MTQSQFESVFGHALSVRSKGVSIGKLHHSVKVKKLSERSYIIKMHDRFGNWLNLCNIKYTFEETGLLKKVKIKLPVISLLIHSIIPIVIVGLIIFYENREIDKVLNAWPFYAGIFSFAALMQLIGILVAKFWLIPQIEKSALQYSMN